MEIINYMYVCVFRVTIIIIYNKFFNYYYCGKPYSTLYMSELTLLFALSFLIHVIVIVFCVINSYFRYSMVILDKMT